MHQSLSSFLRTTVDSHFEGPIPSAERERIRIVESAERAFERALSPLERAVKSLSIAYADVLKDSALVEASRQLHAAEEVSSNARYAALYQQRAAVLAEALLGSARARASWRSGRAAKHLTEPARRKIKRLNYCATPSLRLANRTSCHCGAGSGLP